MAFKLLPGRKKDFKDVGVVTDLDAMESEPVAFKFQGETHVIKPISTGEFLQIYEAFAKFDVLAKSESIRPDEMVDVYTNLFGSVCSTIKRKHVESMSQAQAGALFKLVMDAVTGRVQGEAKKKLKEVVQSDQQMLRG